MRSPLSKLFAIAAILFIATGAYADLGSVALGWDKNPEQDVMGYKVYFGTASGVYGQFDDVSQTTASVSDLTVGVRYYFAVTAYDSSGLESDYSQEVSTIVSPPSIPHSDADADRNPDSDTDTDCNPNPDAKWASGDCYSARRPNRVRRTICHL